jgi:preprotein translocase subunit YajC
MVSTLLAASLAATTKSSSSSYSFIIIIVLIFGAFYFLMIRPQRNRQRQVMQTQNAVVPGQRVRTTAGMYGTVTAVEDGDVVIEVAPGVEVRYLKRAIMEVLSDAPVDDTFAGTGNGAQPAADAKTDEPQDEPPTAESAGDTGAARDGHAAEK